MTHLPESELAAALDPSGGGVRGHRARAHAAECVPCGAALREASEADRAVAQLLRELDAPVPPVGLASVLDRASRGMALAGASAWRVHDRRRPVSARWGVALLAASAVVAAAAVPTSPVHRAIAGAFRWSPHAARQGPDPSVAPTSSAPAAVRGVAVAAPEHLDILFRSHQSHGSVHILRGTGTRVAIRATGDDAAFSVGADTIVVDNRRDGTSSYDVALPAVAQVPSVTIHVGDAVVFARTRGEVTTRVAPDATGGYTIPLGY
jgi:hypothetical protein